MNCNWLASLVFISITFFAIAQEDEDLEDFDISQFEEVGSSLKSFATNKVLGQSPTPLVSFGYDFQGASSLTTPAIGGFTEEIAHWSMAHGFRFNSNIPVISKNNVLVNWGFNYVQLGFQNENDINYQNPLNHVLDNNSLKWMNTNITVFKPLNDRHFVLVQLGIELNGDYSWNNMPSLDQGRIPLAFIFGFKPNDKLIWGPGISRTYLGGALNLLPVVYYYQTFKNEDWGIEALFPARIQMRYRTNSRNVWMAGYNVEGATYKLNHFGNVPNANTISSEPIELRRSEIRAGLTYNRGLNDFIWIGAQAGYRINYSFELDEGEFFRGFDNEGYLQENTLENTLYFQFSISLVSP